MGHYSAYELLHQYSDLAYDLIEKCTKTTFSSVIRRSDKPFINEKIDYLNDKLYDMCKTLNLNFVSKDNISVSNLSRDGLHLNRSGQSKLAANILNPNLYGGGGQAVFLLQLKHGWRYITKTLWLLLLAYYT